MVHRLRRERNYIKENCLWLEVLILMANSVVPSRSNQHSMSTIFPHTSVSIHYKSVAWKVPVRTVEWFSIVGKRFGTYRRTFNNLSSTGPCLLVFKQFPVKENFIPNPFRMGESPCPQQPGHHYSWPWRVSTVIIMHFAIQGVEPLSKAAHRYSRGDCVEEGHEGERVREGSLQPHLYPSSATTAHTAIGFV